MKPIVIFWNSANFTSILIRCSFVIYFLLNAIINYVSNSNVEPSELSIKWEKDLYVLDEPSEILLGIEIEHLFNWYDKPNFLSLEKSLIN